MNLSAVLTQRCNLICDHCYLPSIMFKPDMIDDLPQEVFLKAVKNLGSQFKDDIEEIYLTGGEFLLLSYRSSIVAEFRNNFPKSKIYAYTNGLLFLNDKSLFNEIKPDYYHLGIDAWHNTAKPDGRCKVADHFIENIGSDPNIGLILHWTRREGDEKLYKKFFNKYNGQKKIIIEDRSLNTTTGRAKKFDTPNYRLNEIWRPCDLADHILMKFDGNCYCCHYSLPITNIGSITDLHLKKRLDKIKRTKLNKIYHGSNSIKFYKFLCEKFAIQFSPNRCILCEKYVIWKEIDLFQEAIEYSKKGVVNE